MSATKLVQEEMQKKIRLDESPYTFVRVIVMRSMLISKDDYHKLLKMTLNENSAYLAQSQYSKEINELGLRYSGIALIEKALYHNFINTIKKLKRISPKGYNELIDCYLMHYDIDNLKTLIRAKTKNLPQKDIRELFVPLGMLNEKTLENLMKKDSIEGILGSLKPPFDGFYRRNRTKMDLITIETELDKFYFNEMIRFSERVSEQGILFKEFIHMLIELTNIMTFLRLRKEGLSPSEIQKNMFFSTGIDDILIKKLLRTNSDKPLFSSKYKDIMPQDSNLITIETAFHKYKYMRALRFTHQDPLSVYSLLAYLVAKENEIINLRKIAKSKYLGISAQKVEPLLVI